MVWRMGLRLMVDLPNRDADVMLVVILIMLTVFRIMFWGSPRSEWRSRQPHGDEPPADPALETLRERYARHEITEREYREMRQLLQR